MNIVWELVCDTAKGRFFEVRRSDRSKVVGKELHNLDVHELAERLGDDVRFPPE